MHYNSSLVHVPAEMYRVVGEPAPGTRMYRKDGPEDHIPFWENFLFRHFWPCVSPGGAAQRAGVSHAAVHQRLKEGKLTGFFYYSTQSRRFLFGKGTPKRELLVGYIPVSECQAWRKELEDRAIRQGLVSEKELEGEKPDWQGLVFEWKPKVVKGGWTKADTKKEGSK
jgi:hypothetical protein